MKRTVEVLIFVVVVKGRRDKTSVLECPSWSTGKCIVQFFVPLPCCNINVATNL